MANKTLEKHLSHSPTVALLGPRQVGKTTLVKIIGRQQKSLYLDLEASEDRLKLTDPAGFLSLHSDKLVILDEIQRVPDLFMALRGIIDANRQQGRANGQFLFTVASVMMWVPGTNTLSMGVKTRFRWAKM